MLNTLYRYGTIAYIGGGFGGGIHNTLEPAAFGLPVLFGPKYQKFEEAKQLIAAGGAFCVQDARTCQDILLLLLQQSNREQAVAAVNTYMESSKGATIKILDSLSPQLRKHA
jgi:3-deoxy-D-manno-octulosonic-acid transferase